MGLPVLRLASLRAVEVCVSFFLSAILTAMYLITRRHDCHCADYHGLKYADADRISDPDPLTNVYAVSVYFADSDPLAHADFFNNAESYAYADPESIALPNVNPISVWVSIKFSHADANFNDDAGFKRLDVVVDDSNSLAVAYPNYYCVAVAHANNYSDAVQEQHDVSKPDPDSDKLTDTVPQQHDVIEPNTDAVPNSVHVADPDKVAEPKPNADGVAVCEPNADSLPVSDVQSVTIADSDDDVDTLVDSLAVSDGDRDALVDPVAIADAINVASFNHEPDPKPQRFTEP